jgi:hypothetical protein
MRARMVSSQAVQEHFEEPDFAFVQSKRDRLEKLRNVILDHVEETGWEWNPHMSSLLDQIQASLQKIHEAE